MFTLAPLRRVNDTDEGDEEHEDETDEESSIPPEFESIYHDPELKQTLVDLIETANDLDILDFQEFVRDINTPKPMYAKTQATTGKHIPVY